VRAERGDFDSAYQQLSQGGNAQVEDVPNDLLLAADVNRLSGHPAGAVPLLRRVVKDHEKDPRAPLAAFTLGRVLLDELGQPQAAAEAFARSRSLDAAGPLAADALAREVEAWSRAGDLSRARSTAEEYVRKYPKGGRLSSVRRFGGLD
jgi:transmembrane sensor